MWKDYLKLKKVPTFKQILEKNSSVSIDAKSIWFFRGEIITDVKRLATIIFNELFPWKEQNNYSLKRSNFSKIPRNNCFESIAYLGPRIWVILLQEMQECESFLKFIDHEIR